MDKYVLKLGIKTRKYLQSDSEEVISLVFKTLIGKKDFSLKISRKNCLDELFEYLQQLKKPIEIYDLGLDFDGEFLISYLAENFQPLPFTHTGRRPKAEKESGSFLAGREGKFFDIKGQNKNGANITFKDCEKNLAEKYSTQINNLDVLEKQVDEAISHLKTFFSLRGIDKTGLTTTATITSEIVSSIGSKKYSDLFFGKIKNGGIDSQGNILDGEGDGFNKFKTPGFKDHKPDIKGRLIIAPPGAKIYKFDQNSLFAHIMSTIKIPHGFPFGNCGCEGTKHIQFAEGIADFNINSNDIVPFISNRNEALKTTEYLSNAKNFHFYGTRSGINFVEKYYNLKIKKILKTACFNYQPPGLFDTFLNKYDALKKAAKQNNNEFEYKIIKHMPNPFGGSLTTDPRKKAVYLRELKTGEEKTVAKTYGNKKYVFDGVGHVQKPKFIPLGVYIAVQAKIKEIEFVQGSNECKHFDSRGSGLSSNTDSAICQLCPEHFRKMTSRVDFDPYERGKYKLEDESKFLIQSNRNSYFLFDNINDKIDTRRMAFSGIPKAFFENYKNSDLLNSKISFLKAKVLENE